MAIAFKPQEKNLLKDILSFAKDKKVKLYLVGGILRDIFLSRNKENLDIDAALWDPTGFMMSDSSVDGRLLNSVKYQMGTAIGLALR